MGAYEWGPSTSIFDRVAKDWVELIKIHEVNTLMRLLALYQTKYFMSGYILDGCL